MKRRKVKRPNPKHNQWKNNKLKSRRQKNKQQDQLNLSRKSLISTLSKKSKNILHKKAKCWTATG